MTSENHREVCLPVGRGTACKPFLKAGRECKPSSRLLAAWGQQITACSLGACGFGWSVDVESHSWETDANVCLCSWHFLIKTVSVEEVFLAARVWLRAGSWCEVPGALQGEVGLFPDRTSYQPLEPSWHRGQNITRLLQFLRAMF